MRSGLDFSGQINAVETESEDVDGESDRKALSFMLRDSDLVIFLVISIS